MSKANIYFVITIDTESDHSYDWAKSNPLSFKSITESIPNVLEPLFKRYGAVATYLLSTEVLENYESVNVMKSIVGCELGTHLHPEYIQPKKKYFEYAGTHSLDFSNNYDPVIERDKIGNLTKLFKENIGYQPLVYRAGRYGFGYNSALSLMNFGYLVDTSVTPHISWKDAGGPDFRGFPDQPYFIKSPDGLDCLLEVPVSVIFLNNIYKFFNKPVELRPTFSNSDKMKRLIHKFIELYDSENIIVLNMMFHSMDFYPGASPCSKNQEDCARFVNYVKVVIEYCKEIGVKFCKLSQIRALYKT